MNLDLLRFTTAGSVDDGKSTLIGRLLYDTKNLFTDQLKSLKLSSEKKGLDEIDLSLITDGLRDEREQGITIDVAHIYFSTAKKSYIIADTPGHIQYTRNMVTGASTSNLSIILVDARHGVIEQTKRHTYIASLLNIKHVIVCVNKMDLVDFSEERYDEIKADFQKVVDKTTALGQMSLYYLGDCYMKTNNKEAARGAFRFASKADFDIVIAENSTFNYAKLSYELSLDPYHEAIYALEDFISRFPNSPRIDDARRYLLEVYLTTNDYRQAITAIDKIQKKTPESLIVITGCYAQLKPNEIGLINVLDHTSYVAIARDKVRQTLGRIKGEKVKGKKLKIELSK